MSILRRAITEMVEDLRNGGLFSASAANHPQVFPNYYVGILQAAELTGRLDESLDSLALMRAAEMEIGRVPCTVMRLSYTGEEPGTNGMKRLIVKTDDPHQAEIEIPVRYQTRAEAANASSPNRAKGSVGP